MIPIEALKACPTSLARHYQPLYAKVVVGYCCPLQWRSGHLYECYTGSGCASKAENFRSLYVSSTVGKGSTSYSGNESVRTLKTIFTPAWRSPTRKRHKLAIGLVFLDTRSAYRIARELAVGSLHHDAAAVHIS